MLWCVETSGDVLFDFGRLDIALGAVVGERHVGVAGEATHVSFILDEDLVQVVSVGNPRQFGNCLRDAACTLTPCLLYFLEIIADKVVQTELPPERRRKVVSS